MGHLIIVSGPSIKKTDFDFSMFELLWLKTAHIVLTCYLFDYTFQFKPLRRVCESGYRLQNMFFCIQPWVHCHNIPSPTPLEDMGPNALGSATHTSCSTQMHSLA